MDLAPAALTNVNTRQSFGSPGRVPSVKSPCVNAPTVARQNGRPARFASETRTIQWPGSLIEIRHYG